MANEVGQGVTPSADARMLFNRMMSKATTTHDAMYLSLGDTFRVSLECVVRGTTPSFHQIDELVEEGWIRPGPDGGWQLG